MSERKLTDLGLAEFVAGLISETFEAVSSSLEDQTRRHSDLLMAADLDVADFARKYISDEQVDDAAFSLFGTEDKEHPVQEGAPYTPSVADRPESPQFNTLLGLELVKEVHFTKTGGYFSLTKEGADFVLDKIREHLALEQQTTLQNMLNEGLPKIVVDRGRINSKVTFEVSDSDEEEDAQPTPVPRPETSLTARTARLPQIEALNSSKLKMVNRLGTNRSNLLLPGVKFKIKQADASSTTSSTTSVFGEVEIEFRTVS